MADRFPLIVDPINQQIKELPTGDNLDLTDSSIVNVQNITTIGDLTVQNDIIVSGTVDGRDINADGSKLDTIDTNADVTTSSTVQAAGALMDSELTDENAVKAIDQGLATTDSVQFADITANQLSIDSFDITTISGNGSGITMVDAAFLDGLDSTQFLRSDEDDTFDGNLEVTGDLRGPATFTIDPATHGDNSGTVVIAGTLTVSDLTITVADGATDPASADGAGLLVDGTSASILYDATKDGFDVSPTLYLDDGSQEEPSYSFTEDPDTGIYRYSNNAIGISVGGSDGWVVSEGSGDEADFVVFGVLQAPELNMVKKNIASGTTGDVTLHHSAGSVNLGAGDTTLTVTNDLVDENSVVIGTVATNDANTNSVKIVPSFGQFVIYPDQTPDSETKINFMVVN